MFDGEAVCSADGLVCESFPAPPPKRALAADPELCLPILALEFSSSWFFLFGGSGCLKRASSDVLAADSTT